MVIHRGHNGQDVFLGEIDRHSYLASLRDAAREARVAIHAYGLRPSDVRLLATPETEEGLAMMMQSIGRRFVRPFNQRHGRSGTPWEGRFRSTVIEGDLHLIACMRFVEFAGGVALTSGQGGETPEWSSAAHHLHGTADALVVAHACFWALGNTPFEREAAYRKAVSQPADERETAAILVAVRHGWVLGSDRFAARASERAGRRSRPAAPGRPRKVVGQNTT